MGLLTGAKTFVIDMLSYFPYKFWPADQENHSTFFLWIGFRDMIFFLLFEETDFLNLVLELNNLVK